MTGKINSYKDLILWQKAMDLVDKIYKITKSFPAEERYSLIDQMRRAAVSVPSNISEGSGRDSTKEFLRFLAISSGSLAELETQILIAERQSYIEDSATIIADIAEIKIIMLGLKRSLKARL